MTYSPRSSGLGNSAAYQVSGKPYVTGSLIDFESGKAFGNSQEYKVTFPSVTKSVTVVNNCTASSLAVYFVSKAVSPSVMNAVNYYIVPASATNGNVTGSITFDVKCKEIFISPGPAGATLANTAGTVGGPVADGQSFGVRAELTHVMPEDMYTLTGSGINISSHTDGHH